MNSFLVIAFVAASVLAQDSKSLLSNTAKAIGADGLKTLHYSGTGSSYVVTEVPGPAGGWNHSVMKSYVRDVNLQAPSSRTHLVRMEGTPPAEKTLTHAIDGNSPWSSQYEFWITPFGFLKGALSNNVTVESKTVFGTPYRAVTFTLPGNHRVVGYLNDKDLVEKVETWIGEKSDVLVEAFYRDYADFNGVKFPTVITEKIGGNLSLILVVENVKQ